MGYLRNAREDTWRDRWSNERVQRQCGVKDDVTGSVTRNELGWSGYKERMGNGKTNKTVHRSNVTGERGGKPRMQ